MKWKDREDDVVSHLKAMTVTHPRSATTVGKLVISNGIVPLIKATVS